MFNGKRVAVIIAAGGIGSRVGSPTPKQFLKIGGRPVIVKATEIFEKMDEIDYIFVATREAYEDHCRELMEQNGLKKRPSGVSGAKKELSYENLSDEGITLDELKQKVKEDVERYGGTEYWIGISIEENRININLF